MGTSFSNKKILVTGGNGAFSKKFLNWVRDFSPKKVVVFSRDEMKHAATKREMGSAPWIEYIIGDITSAQDLKMAMHDVDVVIHAAAMKHLPECEANVAASTRVNVIGTSMVCDAFLSSPASHLIFLSTDKAPYNSTAYGAQKYLAERLVTETAKRAPSGKIAYCLRYSNVMDSTGAAFHIFRDLLNAGKTATVNGTTTTRGFVSQAQVIEAIDTSLSHAKGGEVFVLVPKVVRISDLAMNLQELLGKGAVEVKEQKGFAGEKESATLITQEEVPFCKEFKELSGTPAFMLDLLQRHSERPQKSPHEEGGLTLGHCPTMDKAELKNFLGRLL